MLFFLEHVAYEVRSFKIPHVVMSLVLLLQYVHVPHVWVDVWNRKLLSKKKMLKKNMFL